MAISDKQMQIMAFPFTDYDALICDGAIRSGKTCFMMLAFVDDAMRRYDGQRFAICGKTVDSTVKNIITPYLGMVWANERYVITWRRTDKLLIVSSGEHENAFEVFGGKDEASFMLIQGRTLAGVLLDEVALQPRSFVEQALARCSVAGSKMWFNCNPGPPSHWFYIEWILRAEERNALHLHFALEDNPSLDSKIVERYHKMYTGVFYDRYILGRWVQAEGLIYPMASDALELPYEPQGGRWREVALSIDYGTQNAFAALLWGRDGNTWHAFAEYRYSGRDERRQKTDEDYVRDMERFVSILPDNQRQGLLTIIDPSAASFIAAIARSNLRFRVRKADNDVLDGIRDTAVCLQRGTVRIFDTLMETRKELEGYIWDEKGEDRPVKENDHCLTGDTLVDTENGKISIRELCGKTGRVWSFDGFKPILRRFFDVRMTRKNAEVYRIRLKDGRCIDCTGEHLILTANGWKKAKHLKESDKIVEINVNK